MSTLLEQAIVDAEALKEAAIKKSNQKGILHFGIFFLVLFWSWHLFLSTIGNIFVFSDLFNLRYHFCFLRGNSP